MTTAWQTYFEHLAPDTHLYRQQSRLYVQALTTVVPIRGNHRVLDFGCGFGFVGAMLAPLVTEIWLWDSSPHMRAVATQNTADLSNVKVCDGPPGGAAGAGAWMGSESGVFDFVLVNSVAQYMDAGELRSWLGSWRRIISPVGAIVLSDLIPPGHGRLSDTRDLLRLGGRKGSTVSAFRHALGGVVTYWRTSRRSPLLSVGKDELGRLAADARLEVEALPFNLTHFTGRWSAILRRLDRT